MENNERDRKLDQWLDEALSQYSAAEPRLGLEKRVLAHIRADEQASAARRSWWRWMPAFAAVAAVLIVAVAIRPYWEGKKTAGKSAPETTAVTAARSPAETSEPSREKALSKEPPPAEDNRASSTVKQQPAGPAQAEEAKQVPMRVQVDRPGSEHDALIATAEKSLADESVKSKDSHSDAASAAKLNAQVVGALAGGATGGVANATAANTSVATAKVVPATPPAASAPAAARPQKIEIQTTAEAAQAPRGLISTENMATAAASPVNPGYPATRKPASKKSEAAREAFNVMGVMLRTTQMGNLPATAQFPTPKPLTREEKLALTASKEWKIEAATGDKRTKTDGEVTPIEIRQIEIAPLPGPEKQK